MQKASNPIHTSHVLAGDCDKLQSHYEAWASCYNADVKREAYSGPSVIANLSALITESYLNVPLSKTHILDSGCGTGLVGVELKKLGFQHIDGNDLSPNMLEVAEKTDAYKKLEAGVDLNCDSPITAASHYDVVVSCGVLTLGHVQPEALKQLANPLKQNGYLIVSTRNSYLNDSNFKKISLRLEQEGYVRLIMCLPNARYIAEEDAHYWVYQKGPSL